MFFERDIQSLEDFIRSTAILLYIAVYSFSFFAGPSAVQQAGPCLILCLAFAINSALVPYPHVREVI